MATREFLSCGDFGRDADPREIMAVGGSEIMGHSGFTSDVMGLGTGDSAARTRDVYVEFWAPHIENIEKFQRSRTSLKLVKSILYYYCEIMMTVQKQQ
jgi:hypothetical protein